MNVKLPKYLIIFCCVFFSVTGLSVKVSAQEEKSVLNRLQRIEDPELGELIRIAIENTRASLLKELETFKRNEEEYNQFKNNMERIELQTVRKVTEEYSEIKLLDSQIEQIERRLQSSKSPETLANELFLAKTELEAKLTNKLAELREIMNIIPIHPLGRRPFEQLNTWIELDVIGEQIAVFNCSKPFRESVFEMKHNFVKLMSHEEAFNYISKNTNALPVRIDISRNAEGIKLSEELNKHIIDFIKDKNMEMEAEVHLNDNIRTQPATCFLYFQDKIIGTHINSSIIPNRGISERLAGIIDPNGVENYIQASLLKHPSLLPQTILLRHDDESKDMAFTTEKIINDFIKERGFEKLVTTKLQLYILQGG